MPIRKAKKGSTQKMKTLFAYFFLKAALIPLKNIGSHWRAEGCS
jgi:hypothetical protein